MVCSSGKIYSLQQAASQAEAISTDEESTLDDRVEFLHPALQAFFGSPVLFPRAANATQSSMACRSTESLPASNADRWSRAGNVPCLSCQLAQHSGILSMARVALR